MLKGESHDPPKEPLSTKILAPDQCTIYNVYVYVIHIMYMYVTKVGAMACFVQ